jgi:hypothetical protein
MYIFSFESIVVFAKNIRAWRVWKSLEDQESLEEQDSLEDQEFPKDRKSPED